MSQDTCERGAKGLSSGKVNQYIFDPQGQQPRWHMIRALVLTTACTLLWSLLRFEVIVPLPSGHTRFLVDDDTDVSSVFSWHKITPTPYLVYRPCFQDFQCARLEVPMDWQREDGKSNTVALAIIRLPAKVPVTDLRYAGPILTNPGGPGGSGVEQILRAGKMTQYIVDEDIAPNTTSTENDRKYHDIISWDPRSIGESTPNIECFPDSLTRDAWFMQNEAIGMLGSSEDSWLRYWYRSKALAEGCSLANAATLDGSEAFTEHVNTVAVVRDVLEIIERHAEWVEKEGEREQIAQDNIRGYDNIQSIVKRTRWDRGAEKLKYWGNSYGTFIGQTFASMYPSRVERMVLDGVVDARETYFGPWMANLQDSDKILERFFIYCAEAGPERCTYYSPGGADAIRAEYMQLLDDIFHHPLGVLSTATRGPDVITWSDVKSMVRFGMYLPVAYFPIISELLADIGRGIGTLMADWKQSMHSPAISCPSPDCKLAGPYTPECNVAGSNSYDAAMAILCSDIDASFADVNETGFQTYWHSLQQQSQVLGDWWAHTRLGCVGWKTKPKWQFSVSLEANTSFPILFINPSLDPVTPLQNAVAMSKHYPGSVVLEQTSEGHTSWSSPSLCTAKTARAYFQHGTLPPRGTQCKPDSKPFDMKLPSVQAITQLTGKDIRLAAAMQAVGESVMDMHLKRGAFGL